MTGARLGPPESVPDCSLARPTSGHEVQAKDHTDIDSLTPNHISSIATLNIPVSSPQISVIRADLTG